ncbi:MAG: TetR/AcrR family transcriptional regulator [Elusimicrobiota bacterium]|nr:MAG: TetR/AcrR family transcriptional regulator [Elusimicrobiota bacterium]
MARPRSFDVDAILDKTVEVFRSRGFEGASVTDLEKATGLRRASLYGAFGDKRALYLAALRRYDSTRAARLMTEISAAPTGRKALERMFDLIVDEAVSDPCGCLMSNAASENSARDAKVSVCVEAARRRIEGGLHAALLRGRADGTVKAPGDPARWRASFMPRCWGCALWPRPAPPSPTFAASRKRR